jgi:hypothetical protein
MNDATSEPRTCEVCGKQIRSHNTTGICTDRSSTECRRERENRERRAKGIPPRRRQQCSRPGCRKLRKRGGVCGMHWGRFERTGDYGPDEPIDLPEVYAGEIYGRWMVLPGDIASGRRVPCRCECGSERLVHIWRLAAGVTLSCGCWRRPRQEPPYLEGGDIFGRLTVLEDAKRAADLVLVRCECGTETRKRAGMIRTGRTTSCGCRMGKFTHGLSRHPLYGVWSGMIDRTTKPEATGYESYGGRGITACAGWQGAPDGFLNFVADMGERSPGMTLDRIDVDGGYWCGRCAECVRYGRPSNCQWATAQQQARNKRSMAKLTRQRDAALAEVERLNQLLAREALF